jgi:DNA-binding NarL/FixJ family response regulator
MAKRSPTSRKKVAAAEDADSARNAGDPIRIFCVDDNDSILVALRRALSLQPDLEVVGASTTAEGVVESVRSNRADIVLLDIDMPGPGGFGVLEELVIRCLRVRTVMFTGHVRCDLIEGAVERGAWGYISKCTGVEEVVNGIRQVAGGNMYFCSESARVMPPGQ